MHRLVTLFYIVISFSILSCDRYNPVNDRIYQVPPPDNIRSPLSIEALDDAIENYPQEPENYYKKALLLQQEGKAVLALEQIKKALSVDSLSAKDKYHFLAAQIYHHLEQYAQASEQIQKIYSESPLNLEAVILSGELYYRSKSYEKATNYLNQALSLTQTDPRVYYWKAKTALSQGDSTQAVVNLKKALRLKSDYVAVYNTFSELYYQYELYQRAIKYADLGLGFAPENSLLNFNKARAFRKRLFYKDSTLFYYRKAFEGAPKLTEAGYYLGKNAFDNQNYKEAQAYLQSTLDQEPENAAAHYYLGVTYRRLGKRTLALETLEKAIDLDPNHYQAREVYRSIENEIRLAEQLAYEDSLRKAYYRKLTEERLQREEEMRRREAESQNLP